MKNNTTFIHSGELKLFLALATVLVALLILTLASEGGVGKDLTPAVQAVVNPFDGLTISAKAAYVYDIRTKTVLYAKSENERLPLASLTKVMSALVAVDSADADTIVTISPEALKTDGDSGLLGGERWKLKDLLDFSLTSSSNDGIRAIGLAIGTKESGSTDTSVAEAAFIHSMNAKADELQMKNTYYFNETGLDESTVKGGAYGSASDMAKLFEYILSTHPELLEATQEEKFSVSSLDQVHTAKNTDVLANVIPGLIASKTGYTDIAGGNLVIAFDPELDRPVIVSVLGSTESGRFADMATLVTKTLEALSADDRTAGK
ncbi:MAG: serine-type D-Ala-D-Ala carboxypeptidase D-alanyl-D-alanine carboxypeptidase [Parcubacteria group bacterium]|nr:serine-type D-Ala-D-Ala carboxypeptidase D-alanyl-D-alanine carboxypeptidase [Parcubacteria group bacterium]